MSKIDYKINNNILVPVVVEKDPNGYERSYDIYSRLLKDFIVFVTGPIDLAVANTFIAQLLFLESQDEKRDINVYINSPGGEVYSGMAVYDTMQYIKAPVSTICIGLAASMAAFLLAGGEPGKRFSLPNSRILIHQPSGGSQGQASDIKIQAEEILRIREEMNKILAKNTAQDLKTIERDTDRDFYMRADEAKKYGIIDKVIS